MTTTKPQHTPQELVRNTYNSKGAAPLWHVPLTSDEQELKEIGDWLERAYRQTEHNRFIRKFIRQCTTDRITIANMREQNRKLVKALRYVLGLVPEPQPPTPEHVKAVLNANTNAIALLREIDEAVSAHPQDASDADTALCAWLSTRAEA